MIEENESNYFCVIPANILYSTELSEFQKLLYVAISGLTKQSGHCWASNKYLADKFGKSQTWISLQLKKLKEVGLIEVDVIGENGNGRTIKLKDLFNSSNVCIKENLKTSLTKLKDPSLRKVKGEYNRSNNINNNYSPEYEKIWEAYERKGSKKAGYEEYKRVKHLFTQEDALKAIELYKSKQEDPKFRRDIERFFKHQLFEGLLEELKTPKTQAKSTVPTMTAKQLREMGLA